MAFVTPSSPRLNAPRPPTRWGTLTLALGAGLAAALLAFLLVRHSPAGASVPETVVLVTAAQAIPARTRLTAALVQARSLPLSRAPEGAFARPGDVIGRITIAPIAAGAAVTRRALAAPGVALGLAFALPPSQRAVTVALDPADGVEEFARPGDHVDILVTDEPGVAPAQTRTALQNVALLAVGAQTSAQAEAASPAPPAGGVSHVTVAVSPAQAQALVLAAARGKIHLALRPADDNGLASLPALPALPLDEAPAAMPQAPYRQIPAPPPVRPLPVTAPPRRAASVTITLVKGSQSRTVSVAP